MARNGIFPMELSYYNISAFQHLLLCVLFRCDSSLKIIFAYVQIVFQPGIFVAEFSVVEIVGISFFQEIYRRF